MPAIPIREFEQRVGRWVEHLRRTRKPLRVSQRGRGRIILLDEQTFEQ